MGRRLRWLKWLVVVCLTALLVVGGGAIAPAQIPAQLPSLTGNGENNRPPPGVERSGLNEATNVMFNGEALFKIASPTVMNRETNDGPIPVEVRARQIEATLKKVVSQVPQSIQANRDYVTVLDPESLKVRVETLNRQPVILASDAYTSNPEVLLTVTEADAQFNGMPAEKLAEEWREILDKALQEALRMRQPEAFQQAVQRSLIILLVLLGLTPVFLFLRRWLRRYRQRLQECRAASAIATTLTQDRTEQIIDDERRLLLLSALRDHFSINRRLHIIAFLRWMLLLGLVFIWVVGVGWILRRFPATRDFGSAFLSAPFAILLAWFLCSLTNGVVNIAIDRAAKVWETSNFLVFEDSQRKSLRISTIVNASKGLKTFVIYMIGILWVLGELNIPAGSVLAIGAIVALAVSFAAQSIVKDLANGFLILLEDQFAIGDVITVGEVGGFVENLNLRVTQLRNGEGRLITIPNSLIDKVENLTRSWSRVDFSIRVAYETDADRVLALLCDLSTQMYAEAEWQAKMPEPPEVLGIDDLSHEGILIRVWIKTMPLQQWAVAREYRRRVKRDFDAAGIQIGMPHRILHEERPPQPNGHVPSGERHHALSHQPTREVGQGHESGE